MDRHQWHVVASRRWRRKDRIHHLDAVALVFTFRSIARVLGEHRKCHLLLRGNMSVICSAAEGRTAHLQLLRACRVVATTSIAAGLRCYHGGYRRKATRRLVRRAGSGQAGVMAHVLRSAPPACQPRLKRPRSPDGQGAQLSSGATCPRRLFGLPPARQDGAGAAPPTLRPRVGRRVRPPLAAAKAQISALGAASLLRGLGALVPMDGCGHRASVVGSRVGRRLGRAARVAPQPGRERQLGDQNVGGGLVGPAPLRRMRC